MVHHHKNEHITLLVTYILSGCSIISLVLLYTITDYYTHKEIIQTAQVKPLVLFNTSAFNGVTIEGKAYIVYDLVDEKIIASHNEMTLLPLASLTKMMTAVSSTLHKNKDDIIKISPKSIEDGYDLGLKNGQEWPLSELLKYTLIMSSNDGAEAVADSFGNKTIFLSFMNEDAKSFGLNFHFTDPAGRDVGNVLGGRGNAYDVAKLFGIARQRIPEILDATTKKRQAVSTTQGKLFGIPNTNQVIETLPGAEGSKTGFTDLAGGNLGVIVDITVGHPVVIIVLGSTREGRFRDVTSLYLSLQKSLLSN
jgi:D-alanyl-D-alanine carboxypeptidase